MLWGTGVCILWLANCIFFILSLAAGFFVWGLWEWVRRNCGGDSFVYACLASPYSLGSIHLCLVIVDLAMPLIEARHILASRYSVVAWDEEGVDVGTEIRGS